MRDVVERVDFSAARTIVDVGGGFGHLALAVVRRYPAVRAVVLDLPPVIAMAREEPAGEDPVVLARVDFVAGRHVRRRAAG